MMKLFRCVRSYGVEPTGQDILKALALGADGVIVGRSWVYGLGAMGEAGVSQAL